MRKFCTFAASSGGEPGDSPSSRANRRLIINPNYTLRKSNLRIYQKRYEQIQLVTQCLHESGPTCRRALEPTRFYRRTAGIRLRVPRSHQMQTLTKSPHTYFKNQHPVEPMCFGRKKSKLSKKQLTKPIVYVNI